MLAGRSGSLRGPPGVPWMQGMGTASGRDVTGRPPGAPRITSYIGPAVGRPIFPTWCSYVTAITGWLAKAAGNWSAPTTDDCSRSLQSQDGSRRSAVPATARRPDRLAGLLAALLAQSLVPLLELLAVVG